jgi:ribosomal protein L35
MTAKPSGDKVDLSTQTTNTFADPAKAAKLAQQIVDILLGEDSVTRQRAIQATMMLLGEAPLKRATTQDRTIDGDIDSDSHADLAAFFDREEDLKPADNAQLCAAYYYSLYGASPFSIAELKAIAADAGVVIPDRVDMTLRQATQKGKKLFQPAGSGTFKPTAAGRLHFAERWKAKPGKTAKPSTAVGESDAEA